MDNTFTYTLAVRDHQLNDEAHDIVTFSIECETLGRGSRVSIEALDAALDALRKDLIKSARFHAECETMNS